MESEFPGRFYVFRDEDEWSAWTERTDPVLHIELRRIAHVICIAPLSANTLGKLANGLSDNLLTSVFRAWDFKAEKPAIVAPAMNTAMYENPITGIQEAFLREKLKVHVLETVEKLLICNDKGKGAMAEVKTIVEAIQASLGE